ncbi:MAG: nucleoside-diphosphate kinase [Nitrosomonadaceae bacterium]
MVSKTFVIIKPDAISRGLIGKIISRFEDKFLEIVAIEMKQKDETWCQLHYGHLTGDIYLSLEEFMLMGPLIGIVLRGPDAIDTVRRMAGPTNSLSAIPGTIRGDFGTHPMRYNIVHAAADSHEAVEREIKLFFGEDCANTILSKE